MRLVPVAALGECLRTAPFPAAAAVFGSEKIPVLAAYAASLLLSSSCVRASACVVRARARICLCLCPCPCPCLCVSHSQGLPPPLALALALHAMSVHGSSTPPDAAPIRVIRHCARSVRTQCRCPQSFGARDKYFCARGFDVRAGSACAQDVRAHIEPVRCAQPPCDCAEQPREGAGQLYAIT